MFKWFTRRRDDARKAAEILVAVHGSNAYSIARNKLMEKPGHASQHDCSVYTEVKRLLGMREYQDTATRYLNEN